MDDWKLTDEEAKLVAKEAREIAAMGERDPDADSD